MARPRRRPRATEAKAKVPRECARGRSWRSWSPPRADRARRREYAPSMESIVIPARVVPPEKPLGRLAFFSTFPRNPLAVIPRAVYEEDFVTFGAPGTPRAWITAPSMIKAVL